MSPHDCQGCEARANRHAPERGDGVVSKVTAIRRVCSIGDSDVVNGPTAASTYLAAV